MAHDKEITISKDGQTATVMASSLRVWERHGWTAEDDGSSESTVPAATDKATGTTSKGKAE